MAEALNYPRCLAQFFLQGGDATSELSGLPLSGHEAAMAFLRSGVHLYTRYSGIGMAEVVCHNYQAALSQAAQRLGLPCDWVGFSSRQAWDIKASARSILLDLEPHCQPQHVFGDMLGLMPERIVDTIRGLSLAAGGTGLEFWRDVQELLGEVEPRLRKYNGPAFCYKHQRFCAFADSDDTPFAGLRVCVAGVTCKDFSTMHANRKGVLGPSGIPLLTFIFDVRRNMYDVVLTECTPLQDLAPFEKYLSERYKWETFLLGPEDLGWWATRRRRFVVFWLRPEHGGKVAPALPMSSLLNFVRRRRPCDMFNGMFAVAPASSIAIVQCDVARSKNDANLEGLTTLPPWEECLGATKQARLMIHRNIFLERHGLCSRDAAALTPRDLGTMVRHFQQADGFETWVDLDHQPNTAWGKQSTPLPTLIGHGCIYGLGINRCLLGDELLATQGLDLFGVASSADTPSPSRPPWGNAWSELSEARKKDLCGNTIHGEVLMSIIGFIIRVSMPVGLVHQSEDTVRVNTEGSDVRGSGHSAKRARVDE